MFSIKNISVFQLLYLRHLCRGVYSFCLSIHPFLCSFVCLFVCSLLSVTFVEFTSKFLVKVSLSEYISLTTHQKAFIFEPWVPERAIFYAMRFGPRVHAPGWGLRSKSRTLLKCFFLRMCFGTNLNRYFVRHG